MVNMALSQLFWDVLMPWNLKSTYFSLKMIHFLSLNVIYVVFWIKYWNLKLPHHCILFLLTICTVSQLFWNRVCTFLLVCVFPGNRTHNLLRCWCNALPLSHTGTQWWVYEWMVPLSGPQVSLLVSKQFFLNCKWVEQQRLKSTLWLWS